MAINGGGQNKLIFANGVTYNGIPNYNGYCGGGSCFCDIAGNNLAAKHNQPNLHYRNSQRLHHKLQWKQPKPSNN